MRVRIHRGTQQIGGTCVELECDGARILLDLGMPLDGEDGDPSLLPDVAGLKAPDNSLLALVISHGHADHWGLAPRAAVMPKIVMGAATRRILCAAAPFLPKPFAPENTLDLVDRVPLQIGPFRITPYLVDHSAYDAYALEIEAGGRRLFYSGDIRAHGRKAGLFEKLIGKPPSDIDVMLMEGSSLGRLDADAQFPTEAEIEARLVESLTPEGFVLVSASAQNIDRMVSLYRACRRTGRMLVLDLYAMEVLRATGNLNIPQVGWPKLAVYIPQYQRVRIKRMNRFDLLAPYKSSRIYPEALAKLASRAVMLFRPAMLADVDRVRMASSTRAIWSQWDGYLKDGAGQKLRDDLEARSIPLEVIHTSGHASIRDLKRLAQAFNPGALVPIHTFEADRFASYFENVVRRTDGEWWEV
ncbi:MBL fold metallo-hydrolase [Microvirga yunnanensis]|uniref:MBL fold metallo-hydrolase n=1 Tax=Microvirga yunnanensis TaxID=2953740 RepID=UPI0021C9867C|nr:MBL fold metallo-hydrolase [Microvirga sp. HBU65207]